MKRDMPEILPGDVIIRRVRNGWIVMSANGDGNEIITDTRAFTTYVYEDDMPVELCDPETGWDNVGKANAFTKLLWNHFQELLQSKYSGGLKIELRANSRSQEELGENPCDTLRDD